MTEKEEFTIKLEEFVAELKNHISTDDGQWAVKGFIDVFKNIYTISSDRLCCTNQRRSAAGRIAT